MSDIKIAIIGRKHDEYLDDEMLAAIWTLLEQATPEARRAYLYTLLKTTHANGRRQGATEVASQANIITANMDILSIFDQKFGFLADAPVKLAETED